MVDFITLAILAKRAHPDPGERASARRVWAQQSYVKVLRQAERFVLHSKEMALDLIAEFEALVDAFEREGIEYAVCGGLSLAIHGHPRATMDIDVLVPSAIVPRAAEVARRRGFDIPARTITFGLRSRQVARP